jgi:UDP:flavonoid glycosyltransferase YjiC (YdhE family)
VIDLPARIAALDSPTGVFFHQQSVGAVESAILKFEHHPHLFNPAKIRSHAMQFDSSVFREKMGAFIAAARASHENGSLAH